MIESRRWLLWILPLLAVALGWIYWQFDPLQTLWMPKCLWKVATSTDCPGCGSQRMIHALVHGDFSGAWRANAFALCMMPVIGFMLWLELTRTRHPRLYAGVHRSSVIIGVAVLVMAWWILRNVMGW